MVTDIAAALEREWHEARKREGAIAASYARRPTNAKMRQWARAERATVRARLDYLAVAGQPDVARALEELFGTEVAR